MNKSSLWVPKKRKDIPSLQLYFSSPCLLGLKPSNSPSLLSSYPLYTISWLIVSSPVCSEATSDALVVCEAPSLFQRVSSATLDCLTSFSLSPHPYITLGNPPQGLFSADQPSSLPREWPSSLHWDSCPCSRTSFIVFRYIYSQSCLDTEHVNCLQSIELCLQLFEASLRLTRNFDK